MRILLILIALEQLIWAIPSRSQTVAPIFKVAVGDTLLIDSNSVSRYGCGQMNIDLSMSSNDTSNFDFRYHYSSDHQTVYYRVYFTPKVPGIFHGIFHLSYNFYNQRCNLQDSAKLEYYCETPHDTSQIIFRPDIYSVRLSVDTAKEIVNGTVPTTFHNYSGKQLVIDSIRFLGLKSNLCSFSLDSVMSSKPKIIPFDSVDEVLNIYMTSKKGPGLTVDAGALLYEHIGNSEHIDTLLLTYSSDPFCCPQANFIGPFTTNGIKFVATAGETQDSAVTIVYSKFVTSFSIDSLTYPFSYTVEDKPFRKILHLHYHPILHDTSDAGLSIHYSVRDFNGDILQFTIRDDYFMFLGLYWVALTNEVRQSDTHDSAIKIAPNPASRLITVSLADYQGEYDIAIYSSTGSLVKSLGINSFPSQINISELSPGTYFMKASGKHGAYYQKFIVE
ncbi:MAG: T9SS type A sorting domain-containing protein [Bacteroidota bacterium]|nr:T9SS type A sorting domain-containing protein [Bacteroidota bacterium]MDP4235096.1 T9SS type A sorting domain-containing protein [Bacteroidota bacterium]